MSFYDAVRRLRSNARVILFCACFCLSSFRPFVRSFRFDSFERERQLSVRNGDPQVLIASIRHRGWVDGV